MRADHSDDDSLRAWILLNMSRYRLCRCRDRLLSGRVHGADLTRLAKAEQQFSKASGSFRAAQRRARVLGAADRAGAVTKVLVRF